MIHMNNHQIAKIAADNIRILSAAMVEKAKSGHPGGPMGGADFINILYSEFLEYDPENPYWEGRDRFFLDAGHMSPMFYSVLTLCGKLTMDDLRGFRQWGSVTPGHPELDIARGIENSSGPLGQGHAYGAGAAIAAKFLEARLGGVVNHTIYAYITDGGIQEEISQGVGRIAGHLGLSNLIMFYDANQIQLSTTTSEVTSEDVTKKYEAWNWKVIEIDGNDANQIRGAITDAKAENERPILIIGNTVMGKGALRSDGSSFESQLSTHGQPLTTAGGDFAKTVTGLGGDPENPFVIFQPVKELYENRKVQLKKIVAEKKRIEIEWANENPELANKKIKWFNRELPDINWATIEQKPVNATRASSAAVLSILAQQVDNMLVASADLSNSDKTDGFLKHTKPLKKGDFSGAFLQMGVAEFTMSAVCIGIALHGGVIPACGTFFAFSDYMKPAIRVAALMGIPTIFIWTHDAFRVGEDGPTHQPVEQEAQIRLMEKLQNHEGENSMLVLRPADGYETTVAWKMALENSKTPTGLILSRQNITGLPARESRFEEALQAERGAYVVTEDSDFDVILLASGSEVSTLVEGAKLLNKDGIKTRIVSVPSEGLFRKQPAFYQESILPKGVLKFGLTAGLPVTLEGLVGAEGTIWGLNSFGFSAPYNILDEKLGYTSKNVYEKVKEMLHK